MIRSILLEKNPLASSEDIDKVATIWNEIVNLIVEKMLEYSDPHIGDIHTNLREEMSLELAKFISFISNKVVEDRLDGRLVGQIDEKSEREYCFNKDGQNRINNTARNCADRIWIKKYKERWEPKTRSTLEKERNPEKKKLVLKRVEDNHYIPKSFIKRYWSESQSIFKFSKKTNGLISKNKKGIGQWGFSKNLYSDNLEAYFGLLESDVDQPLKMILNVEPLNRPQRESLVGFIVIQRLRNPHFIATLQKQMKPIVALQVGEDKENDKEYMRSVYETLYTQNKFYDTIARPILLSRWVIVRSENPCFILPDICNIFGRYKENKYVIMPVTPKDCLVMLPIEEASLQIIPYYIRASSQLANDISNVLIASSKKDFLGSSKFQPNTQVQEDSSIILLRIIESIINITDQMT